jgi:hypothetical protein
VLLANHIVVAAGDQAHGLLSLASKIRRADPYSQGSDFEQLMDIWRQRKIDSFLGPSMRWHVGGTFSEDWGVINLVHHFRNRDCSVRRDRIYSILALCREGKGINVDYDVPEQELMRQVLNTRKEAICLCSMAIVGHALAPWNFPTIEQSNTEALFAELHMYAGDLSSKACSFCANWIPFSWTRRKGLVFCLASACPDAQGHIFLDRFDTAVVPHTGETRESQAEGLNSIYLQQRQNNNSLLLCKNGNGLEITQSKWNYVYHLRFTLRTMLAVLKDDMTTGGLGLNNCGHLWPGDSKSRTSDDMRLRLCNNVNVHVE